MPRGVRNTPKPEAPVELDNQMTEDAVKAAAPANGYVRRKDQVYFESVRAEPRQFPFDGNRGFRLNDGRVAWRFPKAEVERLRKHAHVLQGRIREV